MSAPKHTDGPWRAVRRNATGAAAYIEGCGVGCPQIAFASCVRVRNPLDWEAVQEANARLIAASPDLLRAVMAAEDFWGDLTEGEVRHHYGDDAADLVCNLRAAIAKATGEGAQ